jgi:hypothetical protein
MVNKKNWFGILVITLVFGMTVIGCEDLLEDKGYTFEFEVLNNNQFAFADYGGGSITQIEFLNGDNPQAPVIQTETVSLSSNQKAVFKVSGFTVKDSYWDDKRVCAVSIIYADGTRGEGIGSGSNNKIMYVNCSDTDVYIRESWN